MGYKTYYNKRIWTRDLNDLNGGPMSSMHAHIEGDLEAGEVRGEINFRDCDSQISYEHWVTKRKKHVRKALKTLYKVRDFLNAYITAYEEICEKLDDDLPP